MLSEIFAVLAQTLSIYSFLLIIRILLTWFLSIERLRCTGISNLNLWPLAEAGLPSSTTPSELSSRSTRSADGGSSVVEFWKHASNFAVSASNTDGTPGGSAAQPVARRRRCCRTRTSVPLSGGVSSARVRVKGAGKTDCEAASADTTADVASASSAMTVDVSIVVR